MGKCHNNFLTCGSIFLPEISGIAEEDINCRCTEGIKVAGVNTQYRKDNMSKKVINMTTYDEWKQTKGMK